MTPRSTTRPRWLSNWAGLAGGLVLLTACGGAGTAAAPVTVTAPAVTVTAPGSTQVLTVTQSAPAAAEPGQSSAGESTGESVAAEVETLQVNRSFAYGPNRVTIKDVVFDPSLDVEPVPTITINLVLENIADFTAGSGFSSLRIGDDDYRSELIRFNYPPPGERREGQMMFKLKAGDEPDLQDAVLYFGDVAENQPMVPLGSDGSGLVDHTPVPFTISGEITVGSSTSKETYTFLKAQVSPAAMATGHMGTPISAAGNTAVQVFVRRSGDSVLSQWSLRRPDGGVDPCANYAPSVNAPRTAEGWIVCQTPEPATSAYTLIHTENWEDGVDTEFPITIP